MSAANCHQMEPGARPGLVVIPVHSLCCHYLENNVDLALSQDSQCWGVGARRLSFHGGHDALSTAFSGSVPFSLLSRVGGLIPGTPALD